MVLDNSTELVQDAREAAEFLETVKMPVRIVAHYDCDGIAAAVTAHEGLRRNGTSFDITFVEELNAENLAEIYDEAAEPVWMFLDIGSGQIEAIEGTLDDETVIIADHHEPGEGSVDYHVNPHNVGIDGGEDISGAGVTYLVMRLLDEDNTDLLKYALVGATGDIQTGDDGYLGLNEEMMRDAEAEGVIERKKGLKLYGRTGKSIVESLKYTTSPYLPGITNSES
ncbi:MAG: DHH family phosphoesterase, partial [Candidatus Nanohaloarchaea archaeon]